MIGLPQGATGTEDSTTTQVALLQPDSEVLQPRQQLFAIGFAVVMAVVVLELVRKRKLREEQSTLWILTAGVLLLVSVFDQLLVWFGLMVGAKTAPSALFFGALLFLMLIALQFSIRLSKLTTRNRMLGQRVALLERKLEESLGSPASTPSSNPPTPEDTPR